MGPEPRGAASPPIETRSFISVALATDQPSPISPTRQSSGSRASVKNTSLKPDAPAMLRMGRTSTPGWCMSTMNIVRPLCFGASGSVRASSSPKRGQVRRRRPDLLAVHDPLVAVALGAGGEPGDVGAGARLAEQLAPDLLGREDRPEEAVALLLGAAHDDRGPAHADAHGVAHPRVASGPPSAARCRRSPAASATASRPPWPTGKSMRARPRSNWAPRNDGHVVVGVLVEELGDPRPHLCFVNRGRRRHGAETSYVGSNRAT